MQVCIQTFGAQIFIRTMQLHVTSTRFLDIPTTNQFLILCSLVYQHFVCTLVSQVTVKHLALHYEIADK